MTVFASSLFAMAILMDQAALTDISKEAPELKEAFNKASGRVRMILIVSPG
jgi:hypothetical protein